MKALVLSLLLSGWSWVASASQAPYVLNFKNGTLRAEVMFVKGPTAQGESQLRVEFKNAQGAAVEPEASELEVTASMPDMCHQAPPVTIQPADDGKGTPGVYDVSELYLSMEGSWRIDMTLTTAQGTETESFTVTF